MQTYRVMLTFKCQSAVAYVAAKSASEAEQKCRTRYDGRQFAKALHAQCIGTSGRTADIH